MNSNFSNDNHEFEEQQVRLSDYWRIIYRRKWIIILSFLVVVAATAYYTFTTPPTYEADCSVMVDQTGGMTQSLFDISPFGGKQLTMMNNQVQILKSNRLAREVVSNLLKANYKDSLRLFSVEGESDKPINYLQLGTARLQANLTVDPIRDTDIIKIRVKAGSAYEASFLSNRVAQTFQNLDREFSRGEISQVVSFLDIQLKKKAKDLRESEEALREFQQAKGVFALPEETQELVTQLVDFESQLATAQTDLDANSKRLEYLKSQMGRMKGKLETSLSNISTPLITELKQKIAENEASLTAFQLQAGRNQFQYDQIEETKKSLAVLKKRLKAEISRLLANNTPLNDSLEPYWDVVQKVVDLRTENLALKAKINALSNFVKKYSRKMDTLPDKSLQLARLERAKKLNENIYLMMKQKYEESRITKAGQIGKIRIIDQALPPQFPVSPKKKMNLLLAVLIGLGMGVGIAFFLEYIDNSIKTIEDVEQLRLPLLAAIPEIEPEKQNGNFFSLPGKGKRHHHNVIDDSNEIAERLVTHLRPKSPIAEAYRSLRTQIQYAKSESPIHSILVSSPGPGEGKSTSVTNLAITIAQMGTKTILVDSDLRRPVIHSLFGVRKDVGLTNYLVGNAALEDVIRSTAVDNLYLMTSGVLPPNPAELVGSKRMKALVELLSKQFDYVLFDSPPIIAVTDAIVMAPMVDAVVLVVRSQLTDKNATKRAFELLNNVNAYMPGVLLNDVSSAYIYGSYYYYYYYYYYYGEESGQSKKKHKKSSKKHHRV